MSDMRILKQIGSGSFSEVFLAEGPDGSQVAVKRFPDTYRAMARREFLHLRACRDPRIVKALDWHDGDPCELILEFLPGEELSHTAVRDPQQVFDLLARIAETVSVVHAAGISLNDLKPSNVILVDGDPRLIDFGLATLSLWRDEHLRLTPAYAAPERLRHRINHPAGDLFSLGLMAVELLTGSLPADDLGAGYPGVLADQAQWNEHVRGLRVPGPVAALLAHDPGKRPGAVTAATDLAALAGRVWRPGPLQSFEGTVLPAHLETLALVNRNGRIRFTPGDEVPKLLNLIALEAVQADRELIVLDEAECFARGVPDYSAQLGIDLAAGELVFPETARIVAVRSLSIRTRLFERIARMPGVLTLIEATTSEFPSIRREELLGILDPELLPGSIRSILDQTGEIAPALLSELLRVEGSADGNELPSLLSAVAMPVPMDFLARIWPDWASLAGNAIADGWVRMKGNDLYALTSFLSPGSDLIGRALEVARNAGFTNLAIRLEFLNGDVPAALKRLEDTLTHWLKQNRYGTAHDVLEWASGFLPEAIWPPSLRKRRAFLLRKTGDYEGALTIYRDLLKSQSGEEAAITLADSAVALTELERFDEAADGYERALAIFRSEGKQRAVIRILNNLGALHYRTGQPRKAQSAFNEVIGLSESAPAGSVERTYYVLALNNLADVHLRTGQWTRGRFSARRAVNAGNPGKPFAISAEMILLSCMFATGEHEGLPALIGELVARPGLDEDPEIRAQVWAQALYLLRILDPALETSLIPRAGKIAGRFDALNRELLLHHLLGGRIRTALEYRGQMSGSADLMPVDALLDGTPDAVREAVRQLVDRDNLHDALHLLTHALLRGPVPPVIAAEATALLGMCPFAPLAGLLERRSREEAPPQLALLWEVITAIHRETDFTLTLKAVLTALLKVNRLQRAVFFQLRLGRFIPVMALDDHLEQLPLDTLRVSSSILEDSVREGNIRFLTGLQEDAESGSRASILGLGLRQAMCCPLSADGETLGVIYADTTVEREFVDDEKAIAQAIVIQSRAAIEKNLLLQRLREGQSEPVSGDVSLLGTSPAMQRVFAVMKSVGAHNVNVVIAGETGTGKEMVARALHRQYAPEAPFVAVNCAAIPETLLESELFGYAKGAFTGATSARKGKIEMAAGGTLFLDEIGDMPPLLQAKLLRVLQDRLVTPLGESHPVEVDFRVIAASNRDLDELVGQGLFRNDLLYRLKVLEIHLPPLRERRDDIALLAHHFLLRYAAKFGKEVRSIGLDALRHLQALPYPGNVRELENRIERAVVLASGHELGRDLFDTGPVQAQEPIVMPGDWAGFQQWKKGRVRDWERQFARELLERHDGNHSRAAQAAGLSRVQLYRLLGRDVSVQ